MSDIIQIAKARRNALHREIAELDAWIKKAEQLAREPQPGIGGNGAITVSSVQFGGAGGASFHGKISNRQQVLNTCREFISEQGTLTLSELYQGLQSRGIDPGTKNPKGMLSIMLSKSQDFIPDKKGRGWMLAKN